MDNAQLEKLRSIKTFPSLVKYLREDLDWPIESDDFDKLTFDYQPEELGLEPKIAVKIKEIKQLRPLVTNQPWGIFFINFEPKRLPVLVLRRVLRSLVLKKRTSANKPQQAAWNLHDLLFISSYGEEDERAITFAHFKDEEDTKLPSLKVIGWDTQDTPLHMDQCADELGKLRFDSALTHKQWREQWSSAFTLEHREVITTSKELAERMAALATKIRKRVNAILKLESETGSIRKLYKAFQKTLIHDLKEDDFADMYAQTVTYGLFSARCSSSVGIDAGDLSEMIPSSNPFLKDLLSTFITIGGRKGKIDFDELGINDVVSILNVANMKAVKSDFDDKNPEHDPVVHFYEDFLKQYDAKKKVKRGVFYTPKPVVSFIVRSVHELLQKEFGLEDGLADTTTWGQMLKKHPEMKLPTISIKNPKTNKIEEVPISENEPFVQILDPAVGTGTFLVEVVEVIKRAMYKKWEDQGHLPLEFVNLWNQYVPKHLLPRLYGFELMMAPYAIAHMKIGLKLFETGYRFRSDERARIYLTNTLEEPKDISGYFEQTAPALAHEAKAANRVKSEVLITVIVGNPPYSISSSNKGPWISNLITPYKEGLTEINVNTLSDDYVKFWRLTEFVISCSTMGVVGMISNNSFLDGVTHRQMRHSLMKSFSKIFLYNLHGSTKLRESASDGSKDENVFDIQQGVSVSVLLKNKQKDANVLYYDDYGTRSQKYKHLLKRSVTDVNWSHVKPEPPYFFFCNKDFSFKAEYLNYIGINEIFMLFKTGVKFRKDNLLIKSHFSTESVVQMLKDIVRLDSLDLCEKYNLTETKDWKLRDKQRFFDVTTQDAIRPVAYRPFDTRYTFYPLDTVQHIIVRGDSRVDLMKHMLMGANVSLVSTRLNRQISCGYFFVAKDISDLHILDNARDSMQVFPLYLYDELDLHEDASSRHPNFIHAFLKTLSASLKLPQSKPHGLPMGIFPEDILNYIYSIFHSTTYRERYVEFLKIDFPRVPITSNIDLFRQLISLGNQLVALHLMESDKLNDHITTFPVKGDNLVSKVGETGKKLKDVKNGKGKLFINKTQYFDSLPEEVWDFHIGGYQVCYKWLYDRKKASRKLSAEDIEHYHKIVVALNETIKIMKQIDEVITAHTGWPIK